MSRVEKTISFRAEDNGTSAIVQKLRRETEQYRDAILKTALDSTRNAKDFVKSVEEQIKALEKRQKLVREINAENIRNKYDDVRKDINSDIDARKSRVNNPTQEGRDLAYARLEEQRKQALDRAGINERAEINQISKEDQIQILLLRELIETVRESAIQEIVEDRRQAELNASRSASGQLDNEDDILLRARARHEENFLNTGGSNSEANKREWVEVFKGIMASKVVQTLGQMGGQLSGARTGEFAFAQMLGGIPIVGQAISTALTRHLEQRLERDSNSNALRGTTGRGGLYGDTSLGLDQAEGTKLAILLAQSRGYRGKNLGGDATDFFATSKAYNLDSSSLMNAEARRLYDTSGGAMGTVMNLLNSSRGNGTMGDDTSKLAKLLEIQNQLTAEQTSVLGKADGVRLASVIAQFQKIGGIFSNPATAGTALSGVNGALKSANNDYQQAMHYAVLSRLNPGASFVKIKEMEEQGIQQKGYLKEYLGLVDQKYGGGENSILGLKMGLNLPSFAAARQLYEGKDAITDDDVVMDGKVVNRNSIRRKGRGNITQIERDQSVLQDAFGDGAGAGFIEATKQTIGTAKEVGKEIINYFTGQAGADLKAGFDAKGSGEIMASSFLAVINPLAAGYLLYKGIDKNNKTKP